MLAHLAPVCGGMAVLAAAAAWSARRAERRRALRAWLGGHPDVRVGRGAGGREDPGAIDLRSQMAMAGWEGIHREHWAALRVTAAAACAIALGAVGASLAVPGGLLVRLGVTVLAAGLGALVGQGMPQIAWQIAVARRRLRTEAELLGFVDLLAVLVEAGLGFEDAARWVCREQGGLLGAEFGRVLAAGEHQAVGTAAALEALADRLAHPEVRYLADAISDGTEMGRGMGHTLRAAAGALRAMRYEALQHRAQSQGISSSVLLALCAALPTGLLLLYPGLRLMLRGL